MQIYSFDASVGRAIDRFDSVHFVLTNIARNLSGAHIRCAYLAPGGRIGYHPTTLPQLFLVVQGAGWARGQTEARFPLAVGRAAFWVKDEWHESGTDSGLTAILIESESLNPAELLSPA